MVLSEIIMITYKEGRKKGEWVQRKREGSGKERDCVFLKGEVGSMHSECRQNFDLSCNFVRELLLLQ